MKLSLGKKQAININKVNLNRTAVSYTMDINLEIINPTSRPASALNKSFFLFASSNSEVTRKILADNRSVMSFLKTAPENTEGKIFSLMSSKKRAKSQTRYSKKLINGLTRRLELSAQNSPNGTVENLTLFAGILSRRSRARARKERKSLVAFDTLVVLQDGAPIENNLLLYEDSSMKTLWLGPVYQDNAGQWYKSHATTNSARSPLYKKIVPNVKVIYTSELDKNLLQTLSNSFESLYGLNRSINSKQAIVNRLKTKTRNYFSPLRTAKCRNASFPLSFSFNQLDFFRNNGAFSKLIKNEQEMVGSFNLISARIVRKRVKKNSPGSRLTAVAPLQNFDEKESVVTDTPLYLDLLSAPGVLTVAANDIKMRGITYGLYSYGVEFTFTDRTRDKIISIINQDVTGLRAVSVELDRLYQTMMLSENYNVYANCLRESYRVQYETGNEKETILNAITSYISAISLFHKDLATAIKSTPNTLAEKLFILSDPLTSGPEGLARLSKLILDLINELQRKSQASMSGGTNVAKNSASATQTSTSRMGSSRRTIKIKHYFKEIVDADKLGETGFDYLTIDNQNQTEFRYLPYRAISYNQFQNLITVERSKYKNIAIDRLTSVSLTPNYFKRPGGILPVNGPSPNQFEVDSLVASTVLAANMYKNSPADLLQFNVGGNSTELGTNTLSILNNNIKIMEKENCTITIHPADFPEDIFETLGHRVPPRERPCQLDASEKMSEQSPFVINKTGSMSYGNFLLNTYNNTSQEQYYNVLKNLNSDVLSYLIQTDYFLGSDSKTGDKVKNLTDAKVFRSTDADLPSYATELQNNTGNEQNTATANLQLLLLGGDAPDAPTPQELSYINLVSSPVSASQITAASLKYGTVKTIQYFAGFRKINDSVMMNKPIWITLNTANLESMSQSGKTILCKMKGRTSALSGYAGIESSQYDETFLVSPDLPTATFSPTITPNTSFSVLPPQSFPSLNAYLNMENYDSLKYSTSIAGGPLTNNDGQIPALRRTTAAPANQGRYTSGRDFLLPNGEYYVGYYHLFYVQSRRRYVAMAGRTHTSAPHSTLRATSAKARLILRNAKKNRPAVSAGAAGPGY